MACSVDTALLGMMSPEEIEAMEKAKAKKEKGTAGGSGGDLPITKSEMRCMMPKDASPVG